MLLQTITRHQLRALIQIAHNIVKSKIVMTPIEKVTKRERRLVHFSWETGYGVINIKKEAIRNKQRFIYPFEHGPTPFKRHTQLMDKLVLVPYVKYQRMLETTHHPKSPGDSDMSDANISPTPKKKTNRNVKENVITVTAPPPGKRDIPPGRRADMDSGKSNAFRD